MVPNPSTVNVVASSSADSTKSGTAAELIKLSINLSPLTPTIQLFHSQQFGATVSGVTNTSVPWAVNGIVGGNGPLGQIATNGIYTPPVALPSPSSVSVSATSQADPSQSASTIAALISDTTVPSVTSVSPADNTTGVLSQSSILITFNEGLDPATIDAGSIFLSAGNSTVPAQYSYDSTNYIVTVTPNVLLTPAQTYTITIGTQLHDLGGHSVAATYTSSFTVESPLGLSGHLTPPSGIDPTTLTVIGFQGQQSPVDSSGNFNTSTSPVGTTLVSSMLPAEASGLMAVAISDTSSGNLDRGTALETSQYALIGQTADVATATSKAKVHVYIRNHQVTASDPNASTPDSVVLSFQTTAEAVLFLSPALFRNDPQGATTIMTTIAADSNTGILASDLQQSWNEPHPLQDPTVLAAYTAALRSILTTLLQQQPTSESAVASADIRNAPPCQYS